MSDNDTIYRQDAIDAVNDVLAEYILTFMPWQEEIPLKCALKIKALPSAQPETNCSEIPNGWIPIKAHPATNEERESRPDIDYWFDCEMPDDGQEILVTVKHKNWMGVEKDVCYVDSAYSLDSGYDWLDDIITWAPLPEPCRGDAE